jgi:hypothetical protein
MANAALCPCPEAVLLAGAWRVDMLGRGWKKTVVIVEPETGGAVVVPDTMAISTF